MPCGFAACLPFPFQADTVVFELLLPYASGVEASPYTAAAALLGPAFNAQCCQQIGLMVLSGRGKESQRA